MGDVGNQEAESKGFLGFESKTVSSLGRGGNFGGGVGAKVDLTICHLDESLGPGGGFVDVVYKASSWVSIVWVVGGLKCGELVLLFLTTAS